MNLRTYITTLAILAAVSGAVGVAVPVANAAGPQTIVSLTFDDGYATQTLAGQVLKDNGLHGTFYVITGGLDHPFFMTWAQVLQLQADGNEIGGHTLDHPNLADPSMTDAEATRQICDDRAALAAHGITAHNFAYPFGLHGATTPGIVKACGYDSARTTEGLQGPGCPSGCAATAPVTPVDPYILPSSGSIFASTTLADLKGYVTTAEQSGGGWLPLVFHRICDPAPGTCDDGYGTTPATLTAFVTWLAARSSQGTVVRTMRQVLDKTPPQTTIDSGPSGLTTATSASLHFSTTEPDVGSSFECRLDAGAWTTCTTPQTPSALPDGDHTYEVRATDVAGNVDPTPASRTWTVDTTPPQTSIDSGPAALTNSSSASLQFSTSEPAAGSSFECRLDNGAWAACGAPQNLSGLGDGSHTYEVRATDVVGNTDPTPATRSWTVDSQAPQTTITAGPAAITRATSALFGFATSKPAAGSAFECRLDGGSWTPCTDGHRLDQLGDGRHTLEVRATDAAGNVSAVPASRTWTVDTHAPQTTVSLKRTSVRSRLATLRFASRDAGATFKCRIDSHRWVACATVKRYHWLAHGRHRFQVRATDVAGNTDATPATVTWTRRSAH